MAAQYAHITQLCLVTFGIWKLLSVAATELTCFGIKELYSILSSMDDAWTKKGTGIPRIVTTTNGFDCLVPLRTLQNSSEIWI
ncbi:hypothetical protein BGX21_000479, partial [Mortierella sp. AD011]